MSDRGQSYPHGKVTYERRALQHYEIRRWDQSHTKLTRLDVRAAGNIEEDGVGMLQARHRK